MKLVKRVSDAYAIGIASNGMVECTPHTPPHTPYILLNVHFVVQKILLPSASCLNKREREKKFKKQATALALF